MLTHLDIFNFTIVGELHLEFSKGMTVITGETGAGKSIMIDALELALGARGDSSMVRPGCERCDIAASFDISNNQLAQQWLLEHDLDTFDECILRRTINASGRSRSTINGHAFPLHKIKNISQLLVNICGQHQQQSLNSQTIHRLQLDSFADNASLVQQVKDVYEQRQACLNELQSLNNLDATKYELLQYQISELDELNLQAHELEILHQEQKQLSQAETILHDLATINQLLNGNDGVNVENQLLQSLQKIEPMPLAPQKIKSVIELLNAALIHCQEATDELKAVQQTVSLQPERLLEIEKRLERIYDIARKHKIQAEQLVEHHLQLKAELNTFLQNNNRAQELQKQVAELETAYSQVAQELSLSRQAKAPELSKKIMHNIHQLGMPQASFEIRINSVDAIKAHGMDEVAYLVRTNPGQNFEPLSKVASGGEISRISLAIEVITSHRHAIPTLLFDEVDTGIGGSTAVKVGQLLRQLADQAQIICVTHQPQVAGFAAQHFFVEKKSNKNSTTTQITRLDAKQKINEIARMLGGIQITEQTLAHAKELIEELQAG